MPGATNHDDCSAAKMEGDPGFRSFAERCEPPEPDESDAAKKRLVARKFEGDPRAENDRSAACVGAEVDESAADRENRLNGDGNSRKDANRPSSAATRRKASGDPMKRLTYRWQRQLAIWRAYGGSSSSEVARYMRRELRRLRGQT